MTNETTTVPLASTMKTPLQEPSVVKPHQEDDEEELEETESSWNTEASEELESIVASPPTPEWPQTNPLYIEKRLLAKHIGDLEHCMIFRKNGKN